MNLVEKIAEARVRFQATNPKMSGENTFAKYSYFELADILPIINTLGHELGFLCVVSFGAEFATLDVVDTAEPASRITFMSPMSTAALKGCHEVQNLGAVETYVKRYLYQNAFEIVESDALNKTHGQHAPEPLEAPPASPQAPSAPRPAGSARLVPSAGEVADTQKRDDLKALIKNLLDDPSLGARRESVAERARAMVKADPTVEGLNACVIFVGECIKESKASPELPIF
jgi:hypothetical protein